MTKSILLSCFAVLCILAAVSATCTEDTKKITPTSNTFRFAHSLPNVQITYYTSASGDIEVSTTTCADTTADSLVFALANNADHVALTASAPGTTGTAGGTGTSASTGAATGSSSSNSGTGSATGSATGGAQVNPKTNAAGRAAFNPITTLALLAASFLCINRKNEFSLALLIALVCVVMFPSVSIAGAPTSVTVRIGLPATINSICENSVCVQRNGGAVQSFVSVQGDRFATMDVTSGGKCDESSVMQMPSGWSLATATDNALLAIAFHDWLADGVVVADGTVYANRQYNSKTGSAGFTTIANKFGAGQNGYQVTQCSKKILITQRFPLATADSSVLVSAFGVKSFVTFNGYDYAAADNTACDSTALASQVGGVHIPTASEWKLAPEAADTFIAMQSSSRAFGADCLVLETGNSFSVSKLTPCDGKQLVSACNVTGCTYGVPSSAFSQRILVRRSSSASSDSWTWKAKIYHAQALGADVYATLDNADPSSRDDNGCQRHYHALPAGWKLATSAQLTAFGQIVPSSAWKNTMCFVSVDGGFLSRDKPCSGIKVLTKQFGGDSLYSVDSCAKILIVRDNSVEQTDFAIAMRVLVISTSNVVSAADNAPLDLAKNMLLATAIPYDWIYLQDAAGALQYPGALPLLDTDGNPKYYGIIFTVNNPASLTAAQRTQLQNYRFMYSVRTVVLSGAPDTAQHVQFGTSGTATPGSALRFDPDFVSAHGDLFSGVVPTAAYDYGGQYYISALGVNFTPVLRLVATATTPSTGAAPAIAGIVTNVDNTQEMQFYVGNALYFDFSPVVANVWISWLTRGLWVGNRRVYFSAQVDDLFLATEQYANTKLKVRMTGVDLRKTKDFLATLNPKLPAGSHITLEFGVNNAEAKTPNSELFDAVRAMVADFFWESHTWSHLNLNCNPEDDCALPNTHATTYEEAHLDLKLNNDYTQSTLFAEYGGLDTPTWSKNCIITPMITGLLRTPSLKALVDNGYDCVVGDNSVAKLIQSNPYRGAWTTTAYNGYEGIFIIPRWPTEIYYNAATAATNVKLYNDRYAPGGLSPAFPAASTMDDILKREADNNFRHLAVFRHDPFMFHQCNLFHFSYKYKTDTVAKEWSLMSLWLQAMADRYMEMLSFPLLHVKHQDLRDVYLARVERDDCGLNAYLNVASGKTSSVSLSTTGSCEASITGLTSCDGVVGGCRTEHYGSDTTLWAQMKQGVSKTVPASPAKWNN